MPAFRTVLVNTVSKTRWWNKKRADYTSSTDTIHRASAWSSLQYVEIDKTYFRILRNLIVKLAQVDGGKKCAVAFTQRVIDDFLDNQDVVVLQPLAERMLPDSLCNGRNLAHFLIAVGLNQGFTIEVIGADTTALERALYRVVGQSHGALDGQAVTKAVDLGIECAEHQQ